MQVIQYISTNQQLSTMCETLHGIESIAVDTEFLRRKTFYPCAALFQIACADFVFLIDPLTINEWQPLCEILIDQNTIKIMHACWEDIEVFNHFLGVIPANIMDTQIALSFCNIGWSMGYHSMVEMLLNVSLSKSATMTNWLQRPLTEQQLNYAKEDVTYLLKCFDILQKKLKEEKKWHYFIQQNSAIIKKFNDSLDISNYYKKIKPASQLSHHKQMLLDVLSRWRETKAHKKNIPRSWLVNDKMLLAIVDKINVDIPEDLLDFLSSDKKTKPFAEEILNVLKQNVGVSDSLWPDLLNEKLRLPKGHAALEWRGFTDGIAKKLNINQQLLLSKDEYISNLIQLDNGSFDFVIPVDWPQWKQELVGLKIKDWLLSLN